MSSFFSSYSICSRKDKVKIVDRSYSSIVGKGIVFITPTLPLSFVLHVPNFMLNLLSLSHIIKSLNCCVMFFFLPSHYVFQNLDMKKTIGRGHEEDGLYVLDGSSHSPSSV